MDVESVWERDQAAITEVAINSKVISVQHM
jgi:hypothetical protein